MSIVLDSNPPSFSSDNPFILVRGQPDASTAYSIEGRAGYIDGRQYQIFDQIFEEHAREWDAIADGVAAELIQLSNLPEDVLAEIWEAVSQNSRIAVLAGAYNSNTQALKATYISAPRTCETQQGYLSRDEFFVLLAELQYNLGLSDHAFSNTLLNASTPRLRRNPFNRRSVIDLATPPQSPIRAPPIPPKVLKDDSRTSSGRISIHIDVQELGQSELGPSDNHYIADGYDEYIRSFGSPTLAQSSSSISRTCDFLLPSKVPAENVYGEASRSSDKEVILEHWVPKLPQIEDVEFEEASDSPTAAPLNTTGSREDGRVERSYIELEATPARTRWDADDFGTVRSLHQGNNSGQIREDQRPVQGFASPRSQQEFQTLSTTFSDQLAVERITSLVTSESTVHRRRSMRRPSIGNALNLVRKRTMHFRNKSTDLDKAPSGYLYARLAEALQDAVAEGNISLVASLFKLGANVNYSSVKNHVYHNILQVAVASGHEEIVDYFIEMGADGISVDNALITAFFADNIDLAIKLAPHAEVYHLRPFETPGPEYQKLSASSLGRVIRDRTMPARSRLMLLRCFMSQGYFDTNKVVFQAHDTANERLFEFSTLATLVAQLDVEAVAFILSELGTVKRHAVRKTLTDRVHQMGAICCIRPSHWQLSSDRAFTMLELLVEHSADVGEIAYWPGSGEMSPLACAVSGGSLEGVSILLALDADPECLVYQLQSNGQETEAYSALGWAALKGRLDICRLLIDAGATPWRTSFKGYTPLYLACRGGSIEVVEYLLSLDVERSMVDACLLAAVKGDEPHIVDVLLTVGASITPETWIAVMTQPRKPRQRTNLLSTIDLLLSQDSIILEEPVLAAIDTGNFAGLSRILERRNGELDFDKNAVFGNLRWAPGRGGQDCRDRTCLYYADQTGKKDFVALLGSYGWGNEIAAWSGRQVGL
jgi:ankyrin repeat protein